MPQNPILVIKAPMLGFWIWGLEGLGALRLELGFLCNGFGWALLLREERKTPGFRYEDPLKVLNRPKP